MTLTHRGRFSDSSSTKVDPKYKRNEQVCHQEVRRKLTSTKLLFLTLGIGLVVLYLGEHNPVRQFVRKHKNNSLEGASNKAVVSETEASGGSSSSGDKQKIVVVAEETKKSEPSKSVEKKNNEALPPSFNKAAEETKKTEPSQPSSEKAVVAEEKTTSASLFTAEEKKALEARQQKYDGQIQDLQNKNQKLQRSQEKQQKKYEGKMQELQTQNEQLQKQIQDIQEQLKQTQNQQNQIQELHTQNQQLQQQIQQKDSSETSQEKAKNDSSNDIQENEGGATDDLVDFSDDNKEKEDFSDDVKEEEKQDIKEEEKRDSSDNKEEQDDISSQSSSQSEENINDKIADNDVWIQLAGRRRISSEDSMAINIKRGIFLKGYAHCYMQSFCISQGGQAEWFPELIERCPDDLEKKHKIVSEGWDNEKPMFENAPLTEPGLYQFESKYGDEFLEKWTNEHLDCAFDETMRQQWGTIIVDAATNPNNPEVTQEEFFQNKDPEVVTVALNLREGSHPEWRETPVLDHHYIILLRQLRSILTKAGKTAEIHIFAEDHEVVIDQERNITRNWKLYGDLVDGIHLSPKDGRQSQARDTLLRDWRHFVQADILITGGMLSSVVALGRPKTPDPETGLPLTIHFGNADDTSDWPKYVTGWSSRHGEKRPDRFSFSNLPEVFAKLDTEPIDKKEIKWKWKATISF